MFVAILYAAASFSPSPATRLPLLVTRTHPCSAGNPRLSALPPEADGSKLDDFLVLMGRCYGVAGAAHAADFATMNALPAMAGLPPFGALGAAGQAAGVLWCALGLVQPLAASRVQRTAGVVAYGAYEVVLTLAASAAVPGDAAAAATRLAAALGLQAVVAFCFWELRRQSLEEE